MQQRPRRRRRPALSCIDCRRRKIKCDRNDPCSNCVSAKSPCTYHVYGSELVVHQHSQRPSSGVSVSSPSVLPCTTSLQPRNTITGNLTTGFGDNFLVPPATVVTATTEQTEILNGAGRNADSLQRQNQDVEQKLHDLQQRIEKLEKSSTSASIGRASEAVADVLRSHSSKQGSHIILNKTRMLSASYWKTSTEELSPVMSCYLQATNNDQAAMIQDDATRTLVAQMGELLRTAKHITKLIKMTRPNGTITDPNFNLFNPSRDLADRMATLYFQSFESTHRILHAPTFWAEYRRYWEHPESSPTSMRLKVLLVVGLGSSLDEEKNPDAEIRIMMYQWVHAAQTWLAGPLKKDRLDLSSIQIYCLTILARQVFSIGGDLVWMSMGSLIHRAMQIGLHRDPDYLPPMSLLQVELRRRLWATILELLVQSTLDAAMPPKISLDEFDTKPPSNINDDDIGETPTALQPHPENVYTNTSIQRLLLSSLPTRLRIIELLHGLHTEISYLDVIALTKEIKNSCQTSDEFLIRNESLGVTMFHRNLLDFLVRRFIIDLHCPFAVKARSNPLFYYSHKISIDTSTAITTYPADKHFSRLMTIGGGMFREGYRCAGSAISYELIAQAQAMRLDGTLHRNTQEIQSLKDVVTKMIEFSVERIRQGETNIKSHMFLSQIMAHVEAIESGTPSELKIAQSGRDSLQLCVNLLRQRADAIVSPYSDNIDFTVGDLADHEDDRIDFDLDFFLGEVEFS